MAIAIDQEETPKEFSKGSIKDLIDLNLEFHAAVRRVILEMCKIRGEVEGVQYHVTLDGAVSPIRDVVGNTIVISENYGAFITFCKLGTGKTESFFNKNRRCVYIPLEYLYTPNWQKEYRKSVILRHHKNEIADVINAFNALNEVAQEDVLSVITSTKKSHDLTKLEDKND